MNLTNGLDPVDQRSSFASLSASTPPQRFEPIVNDYDRNVSTISNPDDDCDPFECCGCVLSIIFSPFIALYDWICSFFPTYNLGDPNAGIIEDRFHGRIDAVTGASQDAVDATSGLKVNQARLQDAPAPFSVESLDLSVIDIDLNELKALFDQLLLDNPTCLHRDEINRITEKLQKYIRYVISDTVDQNKFPGATRTDVYNQNLRIMAKHIIHEMKKPYTQIPLAKRIIAFKGLADAADECVPRIYEETQRHLKALKTNSTATSENAMREYLLTALQTLKEEIILNSARNSEPVHVLNRARKLIGDKWGLDRSDVNLDDQHEAQGSGGKTTAQEFTTLMEDNFIPCRIVDTIRTKLIMDGNPSFITAYLQAHLPDTIDALSIYENNGTDAKPNMTLNCKGIAWVLQNERFLVNS